MSHKKESKIESIKITIELSAHMFYTVFTIIFESVYNVTNVLVSGVMRHRDKLNSFIPDTAMKWIDTVAKEAETNNSSFKAAKEIVNETIQTAKLPINNTDTQETVKENLEEKNPVVETTIDKQVMREEIRERVANNQDLNLDNYVKTIINITIGDIHIGNVENMNSLISTIKELTDKVDEYNPDKMSAEELIDLQARINNFIANSVKENVKDDPK